MEKDIELRPLCFEGQMSFAVTNRGHLIPCCWCDDPKTMDDPEFQKLLTVSKIEDYESIDQILTKVEWIEFNKNLQQNRGPNACITKCRKNKSADLIQVIKKFDIENAKMEYEDSR